MMMLGDGDEWFRPSTPRKIPRPSKEHGRAAEETPQTCVLHWHHPLRDHRRHLRECWSAAGNVLNGTASLRKSSTGLLQNKSAGVNGVVVLPRCRGRHNPN